MADSEMSEVEKLKAKRRAENAAKRAAAGESEAQETTTTSSSDAPDPAPPAPKGPEAQIAQAEDKLNALMTEIGEVKELLAAAADGDAVDAAAKRQAAVSAGVGSLTAMMDEIDIGEIEDDEARTAARGRRKAINKRCALASSGDVEVDGDLAAASAELKKAVVSKRSSVK